MTIPGLGKNTNDRQYGERAIANKDTIYEVCRTYERYLAAWEGPREVTRENFRYAEGRVWTEEMERALLAAGMPALRINLIWPRLLRIAGQELQVRKKIQAVSRREGTEDGAMLANDVFDWVDYNCKMQDMFSLAFMHTVIGELGGWIEVRWDTRKDLLGIPEVRAWNPFFILDDPSVPMFDLTRKQAVIKSYMAPFEEIVRMFPDKEDELEQVLSHDRRFPFKEQVTQLWMRIMGSDAALNDQLINQQEGTYRIIEMQKRVPKREIVAINMINGKKEKVSPAAARVLRDYSHITIVDRAWTEVRTITTCADLVMLQDEANEVQNEMFSLFPIPAFTMLDKSMAPVTQMKGPQEDFVKTRSAILHILRSVAAAGWQVPKGSLDDHEKQKLEKFGSAPNYVQEYDSAFGKPNKIQPNIPPNGEMWNAERARADLQEISSIDKGELGLDGGASESGVLHRQKIQQAMVTLEPIFKNIDIAKEYVGQYIIDLMRVKMEKLESDTRVLDIPRKDNSGDYRFDRVEIRKEDFEKEYAIIVKPGLDTQMQRYRVMAELTALETSMPPELVPWHLKIEFTDLPENLKKEYKEYVQARLGPSPDQQAQIAQQLAALQQADGAQGLAQGAIGPAQLPEPANVEVENV